MPAGRVTTEQRDALFKKLRDEPKFRDAMKRNWRAAMKQVEIDPELVTGKTLTRREIQDQIQKRAGWEIVIVIYAKNLRGERVQLTEAVNFAGR